MINERTLSTSIGARNDYRDLMEKPIKRGFWDQLRYNRYVKKKPYMPTPHVHQCFDCDAITVVSCSLPCKDVYHQVLSQQWYKSEKFREQCFDCMRDEEGWY